MRAPPAQPAAAAPVVPIVNDFRLTLESGVPVSTTDQLAKGTIYLTPYKGNRITLPVSAGGDWEIYETAELSKTLAGLVAGTNYDVFVYIPPGLTAPDLKIVANWANNTARTGGSELVRVNGTLVLESAQSSVYVGTIRASANDQCEDSAAKRFVWNFLNHERRILRSPDGNGHTYSTAAFRAYNNDTAVRVQVVQGVARPLQIGAACSLKHSSAGQRALTNVAIDSTTVPTYAQFSNANTQAVEFGALERCLPAAGYHYFQLLEYADAATGTFGTGTVHGEVDA